jgi:hypothetical protein
VETHIAIDSPFALPKHAVTVRQIPQAFNIGARALVGVFLGRSLIEDVGRPGKGIGGTACVLPSLIVIRSATRYTGVG